MQIKKLQFCAVALASTALQSVLGDSNPDQPVANQANAIALEIAAADSGHGHGHLHHPNKVSFIKKILIFPPNPNVQWNLYLI